MRYPMFYENDVPSDIGDIEIIAKHFGIDITDKDIWLQARESEQPPHLGNVYLYLLLTRLEEALNERYPNLSITYEVNALASYFNVNHQKLSTLNQLFELVEKDEV